MFHAIWVGIIGISNIPSFTRLNRIGPRAESATSCLLRAARRKDIREYAGVGRRELILYVLNCIIAETLACYGEHLALRSHEKRKRKRTSGEKEGRRWTEEREEAHAHTLGSFGEGNYSRVGGIEKA